MKLLKIGSNLTIITDDGQIAVHSGCTDEMFNQIYQMHLNNDVEGIMALIMPELQKKKVEIAEKEEAFREFHQLEYGMGEHFEVKEGAFYRKGIELSIPEDIAIAYKNAFKQASEEKIDISESKEFKKLDNFWMWCALNPNPQSREDLFKFLKKHSLAITEQGMFLAYRRVVTKGKQVNMEEDLIKYLSNSYITVKTKWKKNPSRFNIWKDGNKFLMYPVDAKSMSDTCELVGNLADLYSKIDELKEAQFTDAHTHTMDYRIGVEARMPREEGDQNNNVSCSRGLHVASRHYNYGGFGDTPVIVAVNPMDVLAVPHGEDGKLRTCAFTLVAVIDKEDENKILEGENNNFNEICFEHYEKQVERLREAIKDVKTTDLLHKDFLNNEIPSMDSYNCILQNLEKTEEIIKNRVVTIS